MSDDRPTSLRGLRPGLGRAGRCANPGRRPTRVRRRCGGSARRSRAPSPAVVHSSIWKSPSELPKAAMGRRPMCWLMPTGLPSLSSMKFDLGQPHQHRLAVAHLVLGLDAATDHLLGRDAVDLLGPGPHELDAAAGDDEGLEAVGPQVSEQLEHGLVDHLGVGPPGRRMPRGGQPLVDDWLELFGRDPGMGGHDQFEEPLLAVPARAFMSPFEHRLRTAPSSFHSGCSGASALTRSMAKKSWK